VTFTVAQVPIASIEVVPSVRSVQVGDTVHLRAIARDAGGNDLGGRTVTWVSLQPGIATIAGGTANTVVVTGAAQGTATIRATSEGKTADATITVTPIPTAPSIVVSQTTVSLSAQVGGSATSSVSVTNDGDQPLTGLNGIVTYASGPPTGWLTATLNSTTAPATLTLQASAASLQPGSYNAVVTIRSSLSGVAEKSVSVTFSVTAAPPSNGLGIVLLIGDGMGTGSLAAARLRAGMLAMEWLPVRGELLTASTSDPITDSGAAATALATGVRTYNYAIGVGPDGTRLETVLEAAEQKGMSTGLVATSSITHATPAAFAAHVANRAEQYEIARQMAVSSGVDVLLGGGRQFFLPGSRPDGADLLAPLRARGCTYVEAEAALVASASSGTSCVVGLFAPDHMPKVTEDRAPALVEMATAALTILQRDPDGFFLMIEGSQIDFAGHANDGEYNVAETLDFDATVSAVLRVLKDRPNTLVVVTADHETGGLTAAPGATSGSIVFRWTTTGHTDAPVPLFARGLKAQDLAGTHAIDRVGKLLLQLVREK
jgi:alkaline phosphatase